MVWLQVLVTFSLFSAHCGTSYSSPPLEVAGVAAPEPAPIPQSHLKMSLWTPALYSVK